MRGSRTKREALRAAGFTLIEIAVVIVVLSLLLAMMAGIATAMLGQQRREATRQRLAGVETAIALFVSQNKRLPCPADGIAVGTAAGAGVEARNATNGACNVGGTDNTQTNGVVPWRSLGLAEPDVTDGWGNRLTYRVAPELAKYPNTTIPNIGAMDFTNCDPGGNPFNPPPATNPNLDSTYGLFCRSDCNSTSFPNACTPPSTYTAGKGLKIRGLASADLIMNPGTSPSTGAAYVVISHGENGDGAYNNQGVPQVGAVTSGTYEAANNACTVSFTGSTSAATPVLVDDFPSYAVDANHFDDFVLRPSILTVATKAQLGPRAH